MVAQIDLQPHIGFHIGGNLTKISNSMVSKQHFDFITLFLYGSGLFLS